jgi:hypothetical protein
MSDSWDMYVSLCLGIFWSSRQFYKSSKSDYVFWEISFNIVEIIMSCLKINFHIHQNKMIDKNEVTAHDFSGTVTTNDHSIYGNENVYKTIFFLESSSLSHSFKYIVHIVMIFVIIDKIIQSNTATNVTWLKCFRANQHREHNSNAWSKLFLLDNHLLLHSIHLFLSCFKYK